MGSRERLVLLVPLAGGAVFGLLPFFAQGLFAQATGYSGDDPYLYRLAGAATFGYAVALVLGLRTGGWRSLRPVVVAIVVFNSVSLVVCLIEIARGRAQPVVFVILATSIFICASCGWLLARARPGGVAGRDVGSWIVWLLALATAAATVFGGLPLFTATFTGLLDYRGTDAFVIRQAGAATLGYAVMGLVELRSLRWVELRLPTIMAFTFNGLSFVASVIELATHPTLLAVLIGAASAAFTVAFFIALRRAGR